MKTLFTEEGKGEIIRRIEQLTPQHKPVWGKMSVSQMLAHAQKPIDVATGDGELENGFVMKMLSLLFGKSVKNKFIRNENLDKNSPTAKTFKITDQRDFETERKKLIARVEKFSEMGSKHHLGERHPFFGPMTHEEWDLLQWKHLDHHLKQFGV